MLIEKNTFISMDYVLTNAGGEVIDSSKDQGPLDFVQGTGSIISGLDKEFLGKKVGDTFKVTVPAAEAYGEYDNSLLKEVPKEQFADIPDLKIGMSLQAQTGPESYLVVVVTDIDDELVTLDANHPLAGQALTFDVKIVNARAATADELSGGCHGGCDCDHDDDQEGGGCGGCDSDSEKKGGCSSGGCSDCGCN